MADPVPSDRKLQRAHLKFPQGEGEGGGGGVSASESLLMSFL